jgi:hypothetical protein
LSLLFWLPLLFVFEIDGAALDLVVDGDGSLGGKDEKVASLNSFT